MTDCVPRPNVAGTASSQEDEMAHPNAELFAKGYAAFQAGDLDTVRDLFAPDIVWHLPGKNHLSGD